MIQTIAAIIAAGIVLQVASSGIFGQDVAASGQGSNGWGAGNCGACLFIVGVAAAAIFQVVILGVTAKDGGTHVMAGLAIGLTGVMIHPMGIPVKGPSGNPVRSANRALFVHCGPSAWSRAGRLAASDAYHRAIRLW